MTDLLQDLTERITTLAGDWTRYSVVGSFLLYVAGYLAIRFHLAAIGIGTDLAVLDERYLFAGARFLVYLVSSIPSILLIVLPIWLVACAASRVFPPTSRWFERMSLRGAMRLAVFGIVFAVVMVQFVMRQCFVFNDLLLARTLPTQPAWLVRLLLDDWLMPLYFNALVGACIVPIAILVALRDVEPKGGVAFARGLLAFLTAVQVLLLPINYGILIMDKVFPRVAGLNDKPLAKGDDAWLVWEGKEGVTFLVRDHERKRTLLTLRGKIERTEIVGFDHIVPTLFEKQ